MQIRKTSLAAALAVCAGAVPALADESREQALERKVSELESRLAQVESGRGGYFTAASDLEARVSELERSLAEGGMTSVFKSGLKHESGDKAFAYQFYGRIMNDWTWFDAGRDAEAAVGEMNGGTQFRRVRLAASGTMYGNVKFKSELDFASGSASFADVFIEIANCGFGALRVGHFNEPFSVEELTSSRFSTFIERNLVSSAFAPKRNTGIMVEGNAGEGDMLCYQVGMFRDANSVGADTGNAKAGEYNLTARIAGRPMVQDDGNTYLHLGLAGSIRDFSNDEVAFSSKPGVNIAPSFVSTGTISGITDGSQIGLEAAWVSGPICVKGEYATVTGNGDNGADDYDFDGLSLEASWWLTGETTTYDKKAAKFDRPKIKRNFGDGDGMGGWQVAVGYDTLDLVDDPYDGGELDLWRFGVNWWLNPNTRISLNYVSADGDWDAKAFDETVRALVLRFSLDF